MAPSLIHRAYGASAAPFGIIRMGRHQQGSFRRIVHDVHEEGGSLVASGAGIPVKLVTILRDDGSLAARGLGDMRIDSMILLTSKVFA